MANLAAWLLTLVIPIAKKVLIGLGIGWATYEGLTTLVDAVIAAVSNNFGGLAGEAAQMVNRFGFGEALGITCGALIARAALLAVGHLTRVVS